MKITLTQDDVLGAVREYLVNQGFVVPETNTDSFGIFWDPVMSQVTVDVSDIAVARHAPVLEPALAARGGPSRPAAAGRVDPGPAPPREALDAPNRVLGDEGEPLPERVHSEQAIRGMVSQSQDIQRRIPDPTRAGSELARARFSKVQVAENLEDFGKEADDYKDEI